jgi:hypothetical protein
MLAVWPKSDNHTPYHSAADTREKLVTRLRSINIGSGGDAEAQVSSGTCDRAAVVIEFQQISPFRPSRRRPSKPSFDAFQSFVQRGANQRFTGAEHASVGQARVSIAGVRGTNNVATSPIDVSGELQIGNVPAQIVELVARGTTSFTSEHFSKVVSDGYQHCRMITCTSRGELQPPWRRFGPHYSGSHQESSTRQPALVATCLAREGRCRQARKTLRPVLVQAVSPRPGAAPT